MLRFKTQKPTSLTTSGQPLHLRRKLQDSHQPPATKRNSAVLEDAALEGPLLFLR